MPEDLNSILAIDSEKTSSSNVKWCSFCNRQIPTESAVCPFCGKSQTVIGTSISVATSNLQVKKQATSDNHFIEFRASDNIWQIEEREPPVQAEQRRPVLIVDEETILFAHTDKYISPEELLKRVQAFILEQKVPVEAVLIQARWINDFYEVRPRIVAYLKDHAFSGLKMILGLDYMGSWASLQYQIGLQPDPVPKPPPSVSVADPIPLLLMIGGIIGGFIGFLLAVAGANSFNGGTTVFLGVLLMIGGIAAVIGGIHLLSKQKVQIGDQERERERYLREQYEMKNYKARMQFSRTYKIDDMKLFQTAMRVVFQAVVDDIVQNTGGEIIKEVKGGRSEFYSGKINQSPQPNQVPQAQQGQQSTAPAQSNASQTGV